MLNIFAKYGTDEKAAIYCHPGQIYFIQTQLNKQFGGDWVIVDECKTSSEILKFHDGQIYNGFDPTKPQEFRYSKSIIKFQI